MNALILSLIASGCAALSSLFFRKNATLSFSENSCGYLLLFYFSSFLLSFVYTDTWSGNISFIMLGTGAIVGLLNSGLMLLTFRALKLGPAGLTYAFQNASAIFPGIILFLFLGTNFGFSCSYLQFIGMGLVLLGLFLGARQERTQTSSKWFKYAITCFLVQMFALTLIQARCILFDCKEIFSNLSEVDDVWFMPGQFGASFVLISFIFMRENKRLNKNEMLYGFMGGIANFLSTCLLLIATKIALPLEKGILFPCFAVSTMILCNIWANRLYKEPST